jgi:hypothetical protein
MLTTPDAPTNLRNVPQTTNGSQIGLAWDDGAIDGGADILDYTLSWDRADGTWEILEMYIQDLFYTAQGLDDGYMYSFKVQARNSHGPSAYSNTVSILSAQTPNKPEPPTTEFEGSQDYGNIIVRWVAPVSGGSPIIAYQITLRESDGVTFTEEMTYCDGQDSIITNNVQCTIPSSVLNSAPYTIPWGQSIYAKVAAINAYGYSETSEEGNGAVIITNPDAPINIVEDLS